MSKLYVANPTPQTHAFSWVVPDPNISQGQRRPGPRIQPIQPGSQIALDGDFNHLQIDAIIYQHEPYGLYRIDEIGRQQAAYVPLICSIDKPVSETLLRSVMEKNTTLQHEKGRAMRKEAAIAVSQGIERDLTEMGGPQMPGLKMLDMEVEEVRTRTSDSAEMKPQRVRVTKDAEGAPPASRRGRAKRAA